MQRGIDMSITTDALDAIRRILGTVYSTESLSSEVERLATAVDLLTGLVEKMHARILFLEQQQQRRENY